jgi:hypothetical protein
MKDYTIDIVVLGNEFASAFAAKSTGTLSERPLVVRKERGMPMSAAPFIAAREAIKDLMGFLNEDDIVDVRIYAQNADVQTWIARGSGNAALDSELRSIISGLRDKGISASLHPLAKPDRILHAKAEMALLMGD